MSYTNGVPHCDMRNDCTQPVAMLDPAGFIYCEPHGHLRQDVGNYCRKLRPHELRRVSRGLRIAHY